MTRTIALPAALAAALFAGLATAGLSSAGAETGSPDGAFVAERPAEPTRLPRIDPQQLRDGALAEAGAFTGRGGLR